MVLDVGLRVTCGIYNTSFKPSDPMLTGIGANDSHESFYGWKWLTRHGGIGSGNSRCTSKETAVPCESESSTYAVRALKKLSPVSAIVMILEYSSRRGRLWYLITGRVWQVSRHHARQGVGGHRVDDGHDLIGGIKRDLNKLKAKHLILVR